ncbi:MAG: HTH-type transcriptional regulator Lrp [Salinarchaeum sp.]
MAYEYLDAELVNELLTDGRSSMRSLAETLDVSVTTVSNHLGRLEDEEVIREYVPVIDYDEVGYDVTAVLQLKVEGGSIPELTARLKEHRQMVSVYEITGNYDILALGKFKDTDDMNDQIKTVLTDPVVAEANTSVVLETAAEFEQFDLETG